MGQESVIDMLSGFAFKSTDFKKEGKYRLLRGINLSVGNTRWDDTVYVDEMPEKCVSFQILKGDVLIGLDRPWISEGIRVAIYDDDGDTYLVQRVLRIRETAAITKEYIALLLRSNLFRDAVEGETTGISVPHISPGQVGSVVHFYNLYSVFLSIASTLFLSLLTSDFHAIGSITAEKVTSGAWIVCIGSGLLGTFLACYKVSQKTKNDTSNRDDAVEKVFNQHIQKNSV